MAITNVVKSVQDIMRQDVGVDGDAQRISQLVWMVFLKIFDDKEIEYELMDDFYISPIPEELRWRNWATNEEGLTGDDLLEFVDNKLFPGLKELALGEGDDPRGFIVKEIFQDAYNYMKSGTLIRQVINKINEIDFNSSEDRHLFNDIYESILKDLQSAGNAGEYYTPRAVTQFMVDMVDPQIGEKILDPACGTGGFLVCALENLKKQAKNVQDMQTIQQSIMGIEKKPLPYFLSITNLMLHDIDEPNIKRDNSLSKPLKEYKRKDRVEVIVTNPPFGGIEEEGIQANFPANYKTKETADLFLVLIIQLLKESGRAAIVLPDGILFGEGVKTRIKEKLLEECNLHTIVRLPNGVFNPYTGIKTNLLFFNKGEQTKEIWYFEHPYPNGQKSYTKTKPIQYEEFNLEKEWWVNRTENEYAWKISIQEIKEKNYNIDFKNPNKEQIADTRKPEDLIADIIDKEKRIIQILNSLKEKIGV